MKKRLVLFAFACMACLALFTCENQQVIGILRSPSELNFLDITAYADEYPIIGGATLEPSLRPGVFEYTVYVSKDATSFKVEASVGAAGTVEGYSEEDQKSGMEFEYTGDEPKVITLSVQRKYMDLGEYRLTLVRVETVPVAEDVEITITPRVGVFFIGSGTIPVFEVTAKLPEAGGELTYQWYMNNIASSMGGYQIAGATDSSYAMKPGETMTVRTLYYYAEITNTIDGKTGVTVSPPRAVTFIDKNQLHYKSVAMADIPAGNVELDVTVSWNDLWSDLWRYNDFSDPWSTPGFWLGSYPVTWELWRTVYERADAANYRFSRSGNQGGENRGSTNTNKLPYPVGNEVHPVTLIGWRDAVVWCNAYSEMDGLEPVYKDSNGNVLRDSRLEVDTMIDVTKMTGNGYRLPTAEEWFYAGKGANPVYDDDYSAEPWYWSYPGTDDETQAYKYVWCYSPDVAASGNRRTGEVGTLLPVVLPNGEELYDMLGLVYQWVWRPKTDGTGQLSDETHAFGYDFSGNSAGFDDSGCLTSDIPFNADVHFMGLRIARNKEE